MDSRRLADQDLPELDALRPDAVTERAESSANPEPPVQPVVVVHYRPRRWAATLLPPAVLVLLACWLLSLRIHTPDWLGLVPGRNKPAATTAPAKAEPVATSSKSNIADAEPRAVDVAAQPNADPTTVVVEPEIAPSAMAVSVVPASAGAARPAAPHTRPGGLWEPMALAGPPVGATRRPAFGEELYGPPPGGTRPDAAESPSAVAAPVPAPEAAAPGEAWDAIRREAEAVRAERAALEGAKGHLLVEQDLQTRRADQKVRRDFLERLRALLKDRPRDARAVRALMADEPALDRGDSSDLRDLVRAGATTRTARRALIRQLRSRGVSEPIILGALEEVFLANAATRNGPRSADEALLRGAGELLAEPLPKLAPEPERKAADPNTAVRRRPAPDAQPAGARPAAGQPRAPRGTGTDPSGVSVRRR